VRGADVTLLLLIVTLTEQRGVAIEPGLVLKDQLNPPSGELVSQSFVPWDRTAHRCPKLPASRKAGCPVSGRPRRALAVM
jgi:hypothetical protein